MIGRLTGTLLDKSPPQVLVDCAGVGYEVDVPMSTFYNLPALGERVTLLTHFVVREDAQLLFGFATAQWAGILQGDEALRLGMPTRPRNVVFGGGLPMREGGALIGGIGVSGGSAEQDEICARAALQALGLDAA